MVRSYKWCTAIIDAQLQKTNKWCTATNGAQLQMMHSYKWCTATKDKQMMHSYKWCAATNDAQLQKTNSEQHDARTSSNSASTSLPWMLLPRFTHFQAPSDVYFCSRKYVGLARTVYMHCIWPYIWWFPCQKYRIYTVYIDGSLP